MLADDRGHSYGVSREIRHSPSERPGGGPARRDRVRAGISPAGGGARPGGILAHLADLALFARATGRMVGDGASAPPGRQRAGGRVRDALTVPAQCDRAVVRAAGTGGAGPGARAGAACARRRPDGRHAHSGHQALSALHRQSPGRRLRLCRTGAGARAGGGLPARAALARAGGGAGSAAGRARAGSAPFVPVGPGARIWRGVRGAQRALHRGRRAPDGV